MVARCGRSGKWWQGAGGKGNGGEVREVRADGGEVQEVRENGGEVREVRADGGEVQEVREVTGSGVVGA